MPTETTHFKSEVAVQLRTYVYRLIDPRNGETFYVGMGKGDRIFAHIRQKVDEDDPSNKVQRIRDINLAGFEVAHVIHRHGMDDKTALEVEAALIDAYPGLTNIAGGLNSSDRGAMHALEINRRYGAEPADFHGHKVMLISVNRSAFDQSLYEATRYAWKVSLGKANQAEVILPTVVGLIRGAFVAPRWMEAQSENFPGREPRPGRYGFVAEEADERVRALYVGKRVPDEYRKRGSSNPIRYCW